LYNWRICIGSQHVDKAHGNYEGAFVCVEKAVQIIEAHQNVVTPEWLRNAVPVTTSGVGWGQLRQPDGHAGGRVILEKDWEFSARRVAFRMDLHVELSI